jgi:hypothetical protein
MAGQRPPIQQPLWFLTGNEVPPLKKVSYISNNFSNGEQVYRNDGHIKIERQADGYYSA